MKRIHLYKRIMWLLLLLPLFSGCNDSDDVAAIFTGKTWKLNYIAIDGEHTMYPFWENESQKKTIYESLQKGNSYTIRFEGSVEGDLLSGTIKGNVILLPFQGTFSANGKDNKFQASITGEHNNDTKSNPLAKEFLDGLKTATSYEGDTNNLYLLYKSGQRTFRMFFIKAKD